MSEESGDPPASGPRKTVHDAYRRCLQAREQYLRSKSLGDTPSAQEAAHAELHAAVMTWAEALAPYAETTKGDVEQLWTSIRLWPVGPKREQVPICVECETPHTGLTAGDLCPDCGDAQVVLRVQPVRDDEGKLVQEYETGLQSLSTYRDRTEVVQRSSGTFNPTTRTEERPLRLPPENLFRAARLLDQLASHAQLLVTSDDPLASPQEV
jgi:hypothetical protein